MSTDHVVEHIADLFTLMPICTFVCLEKRVILVDGTSNSTSEDIWSVDNDLIFSALLLAVPCLTTASGFSSAPKSTVMSWLET